MFHRWWLYESKLQSSQEISRAFLLYHTYLLSGHWHTLSSSLLEEDHPNGWGCLQGKDTAVSLAPSPL